MDAKEYKQTLIDLAYKMRDDNDLCENKNQCSECDLWGIIYVPINEAENVSVRYCDILCGILNCN